VVPPVAEEVREAHGCGEEEVGAWMAVGGAAGGIAEANGKRAGLFWPGDGVVTRAPWRSKNDQPTDGYVPVSQECLDVGGDCGGDLDGDGDVFALLARQVDDLIWQARGEADNGDSDRTVQVDRDALAMILRLAELGLANDEEVDRIESRAVIERVRTALRRDA
jgi:hypothetical protein